MNPHETTPEFEALLDYLKHSQKCNLTVYKRSTLMRRFQQRMQKINIDNYQIYLNYLQSNPEEYIALLDEVLINVTSFFRDREVWDYLASVIIPKIIVNKQPDEPIRVWSAGCAAGQEIYSLLILLAEALGIESCLKRVQCYATDVDEAALEEARQATYSELQITNIPPNLLEKYFEQTQQGYVFHPKLKHTIIFGRHDMVADAPMSKIDLLICRNVLIYFSLEAQTSILIRFHFALKKTGFLVLGKSEIITNNRQIFTPVNLKQRIYTKGLNLELEDYLSINANSRKKQLIEPLKNQICFWQAAFESSPFPQLAVDFNGYLIMTNEQANLLFGLTLDDTNRPFQELELGRLIASQTSMKIFYRNRLPLHLKNIEWVNSQGRHYFDVAIAPVFNSEKQLLGVILTFLNTTDCQLLTEKLENTDAQLARTSQLLQVTELELNTKLFSQDSNLT